MAKVQTSMIDHIVVYAKTDVFNPNLLKRGEEADARYENPDNDPRGSWKSIPFLNPLSPKERPNLCYEIENPNTKEKINPLKKAWRSEKIVWEKLVSENRVWWGLDGKSKLPNIKRFLSEVRQGMTPINFWSFEYASHTDEANREIKEIFGEKIFETPKPVSLVKRIVEHCCDADSIILDSFAGSGTTAHAVLDLNAEDSGNRKFILVECENYADVITAERVRRVITGISSANDEKLWNGLGGSFSYYELGDPIDIDAMLDGTDLPTFADLAKYVFYTATGEQIDLGKLEPDNYYIGSSKTFEVYLVYEPDKARLKELALNSILADKIHERFPGKRKLVFAPACYLDDWLMSDLNISFAQLPFEIYRIAA